MSVRDRRIIEAALENIGNANVTFAEALRALRESVEEQIPHGRVFLLGVTVDGPIVGSIVSGVGIVDTPLGVQLARVRRGEAPQTLGMLVR